MTAVAGAGVVMVMLWVDFAEQVGLLVPPLLPLHIQVHGTLPVGMAEAVPVLQRLAVGGKLNVPPFALPQVPFITN